MTDQPRNENQETGRLAGFGAGVIAGGQIGTILIPIPFVGTFTGALIGGALGSKLGQRLGPPVLDTVDNLLQGKPAEAPRSTSVPITTADATADTDLLAQLERLGQLRSQGLLTEEEFAKAKTQLLNR